MPWTHIILSKLHISTVQVAIESSQVPRCIHTVTKSHFAQDTRSLPFKALLSHLSFPPSYVRCMPMCSLSLWMSLLEEIQPGNCICSGKVQTNTHTHTHTHTHVQLRCPSVHALLPLDGQSACYRLKTSKGALQAWVDKVTRRPDALCFFSLPPTVSLILKTTWWWQKGLLIQKKTC